CGKVSESSANAWRCQRTLLWPDVLQEWCCRNSEELLSRRASCDLIVLSREIANKELERLRRMSPHLVVETSYRLLNTSIRNSGLSLFAKCVQPLDHEAEYERAPRFTVETLIDRTFRHGSADDSQNFCETGLASNCAP